MIFLLNSAPIPDEGMYQSQRIPPHLARQLVKHRGFRSLVGHEGAAAVMGELLGVRVEVSREAWRPQPGDTAVAIRFGSGRRPENGHELSADEFRRSHPWLLLIHRLF